MAEFIKKIKTINGEKQIDFDRLGNKPAMETGSGENSVVLNDTENNYAYGNRSVVEGDHTVATGDDQHVGGRYNILDTDENGEFANKYADIVGNGESHNKRSNAYSLDWEGNGHYAGKVYMNSTHKDGGIVTGDELISKKDAEGMIYDERDLEINEESGEVDKVDIAIGQHSSSINGVGIGYLTGAEYGISIGHYADSTDGIAIGNESEAQFSSVSIGNGASSMDGIAIGDEASAYMGVQIGSGTNNDEGLLKIYSKLLLDKHGHIPPERLNLDLSLHGDTVGADFFNDVNNIDKNKIYVSYEDFVIDKEITDDCYTHFTTIDTDNGKKITFSHPFVKYLHMCTVKSFEFGCLAASWSISSKTTSWDIESDSISVEMSDEEYKEKFEIPIDWDGDTEPDFVELANEVTNIKMNIVISVHKGDMLIYDGNIWMPIDSNSYTKEEMGELLEAVHQDVNNALTDRYTDEEKEKLEGIEDGANKYVLPEATADTLGGIKLGPGFNLINGLLTSSSNIITGTLTREQMGHGLPLPKKPNFVLLCTTHEPLFQTSNMSYGDQLSFIFVDIGVAFTIYNRRDANASGGGIGNGISSIHPIQWDAETNTLIGKAIEGERDTDGDDHISAKSEEEVTESVFGASTNSSILSYIAIFNN